MNYITGAWTENEDGLLITLNPFPIPSMRSKVGEVAKHPPPLSPHKNEVFEITYL